MFVNFRFLISDSPKQYENYTGDVLALFKYMDKTHYIVFCQASKYDVPRLMFLDEGAIIEILNNEIPEDWVKVNKLCSECFYDGILHFKLDLYDLICPRWMVENSSFFANVIDNSRCYKQLFEYEPYRFKNKNDIDVYGNIDKY